MIYLRGEARYDSKEPKSLVASPELVGALHSFLRAVGGPAVLAQETNIRPVRITHLARGQVHGLTREDLVNVETALELKPSGFDQSPP